MSLPYPPVSYHSFICPQGMAALPKTTTHACSRRAFFSSQHPQRKSDVPNCSPTAVVLFMVAVQIFPALILKRISITILIICILQRQVLKSGLKHNVKCFQQIQKFSENPKSHFKYATEMFSKLQQNLCRTLTCISF